MKLIKCRGSALEMGRQYGEAAREETGLARELWKHFLQGSVPCTGR